MCKYFFNSAIIVNRDAFEALSESDQALLRELAAAYAARATAENMADEERVTADLQAAGISVFEAKEGDIAAARERMAPFWDEWAESRNARTREALAEVRAALGR